jgi:putative transposase
MEELEIMDHMDRMHTDNPAWGSRQLTSQLNGLGYEIGRYKVRRFMYETGIEAIYPKPNLSKPMPGHKVYPYLLKNKPITGPNQAWSIDYSDNKVIPIFLSVARFHRNAFVKHRNNFWG